MGSASDWSTMQQAVEVLDAFGVAHEVRVLSAHRMPDEMFAYAEAAVSRGLRAIIAGAGGASDGTHGSCFHLAAANDQQHHCPGAADFSPRPCRLGHAA